MGIVVEVVGRNGTVIRSQSFNKDTLTVGRSFECDVILNDNHVDAEHLSIFMDPSTQGLSCVDHGSVNGSWTIEPSRFQGLHKNKRRVLRTSAIFSGQALAIGRTFIRVYSSQHWVPRAQPLSAWEDVGHLLGRFWVLAFLILAMFSLEVWDAYLDEPQVKKPAQYLLGGIYAFVGACGYALVWAIVSKANNHDSKYLSYLSTALAAIIFLDVQQLVLPGLLYDFDMGGAQAFIHKILLVLTGYACLLTSLALASNLKPAARQMFSMLIPAIILIPFFLELLTHPDFNDSPPYDKTLASPGWHLRDVVELDEFIDLAENTYKQD